MATLEHSKLNILQYLDLDCVIDLNVSTRDDALREMIAQLDARGKLLDRELFKRAIFARESLVSTGIGMGVAIPHAKLEGYHEFFIAVGIQRGSGLEWDAIDGGAVRLIFMIGGPADRQTDYLRILQHITSLIKNEARHLQLLNSELDKSMLIEIFQESG